MRENKINLLYLIASLDSGGAERQLAELVKNIDKNTVNPHVVLYRNRLHFDDLLTDEKIHLKIIEKKTKFDPSFPFKLAHYIRQNHIDLIHSYTESAGVWGRITGRLTGIKNITHLQSSNYNKSFYHREKLTGWMDTLMIANSHKSKDQYHSHIPKRKIVVIHNGLNFNLIPQTPASLNNEGFIITVAGRISPQKNYPCLLKAVYLIKDEIPKLQVNIWGRILHKKSYEEMTELIKSYKLTSIVHYKGVSKTIIDEISSSHLLTLSSSTEGFPNVVMEALACGVPVIASQAGDMEYLINNGQNGFLFPSNNAEALAEAVMKYYRLKPHERLQMGLKGREHIKKNYSIEKMTNKTLDVYKSLLKI